MIDNDHFIGTFSFVYIAIASYLAKLFLRIMLALK